MWIISRFLRCLCIFIVFLAVKQVFFLYLVSKFHHTVSQLCLRRAVCLLSRPTFVSILDMMFSVFCFQFVFEIIKGTCEAFLFICLFLFVFSFFQASLLFVCLFVFCRPIMHALNVPWMPNILSTCW